jgi:DnaK suppressor protein
MDRKSIARFRKALDARQRELRRSVVQTQKEMLTAQHEYGKDEGERANTSLAKEMELGHKSRDRALLGAVKAALKRISDGTFGECLNCGQQSTRSASKPFLGCAIASRARNLSTARSQVE